MSSAETLAREIGDFVERAASASEAGASPAGSPLEVLFDELVERTFALQWERVEPFRRLCTSRGVTPADVRGPGAWRRVPAVPVAAFRSLELAVAPPREIFRSSGTTAGPGARSVHRHPFPDLYRRVIDAGFAPACLPAAGSRFGSPPRRPILSLVPSREDVADSSLGFMCRRILERHGDEESRVAFSIEGGVDVAAARDFLRRCADRDEPYTLLATAFALADLLDALEALHEPFRAPAGSTILETGGFKGRRRSVERGELLRRIETILGVPPDRVVREYGMTELTGHVYTEVLRGGDPDVFVAPPWMRVRPVDPETLDEVPAGESGLVAVFDLANVGSAIHVLTQDLGVAEGRGGRRGFRLRGRAPGAALRGCSLAVEEVMERS